VTLALRLSTVGNAVLEGNGLAVSVGRGVRVSLSVGVTDAKSGVSVTSTNAVADGKVVSTKVGAIGVDVTVQANETRMLRIKKIVFRLITENCSPFRMISLNDEEVKRVL
jgi:hypothetical protein